MFDELIRVLLTVTKNVYHYGGFKTEGNYIVWAEDGQGDSLSADNQMVNQAIEGTIDYFIKDEDDYAIERIQSALKDIDPEKCTFAYRLNSIQEESDTGFIHYEWVWQIGV